jgi:hypothetical protein
MSYNNQINLERIFNGSLNTNKRNKSNKIKIYKSKRNNYNVINTISNRFDNHLPKDFLKDSKTLYNVLNMRGNDIFVDKPELNRKINRIMNNIVKNIEYFENIRDIKVLSTSGNSGSGSVVISFLYSNNRYIMKITNPIIDEFEKKNSVDSIIKKKTNTIKKIDKILNIKFNHIFVEYKIYKYLTKFIKFSINPFIMQGFDLYNVYDNTNINNLELFYKNPNHKMIMINETSKTHDLISLSQLFTNINKKLDIYFKNIRRYNKQKILYIFNIVKFINEIIYFQLLYCLSCFEKIKLKHNDLHFGNILVIMKRDNLFNSIDNLSTFKSNFIEDGKFKNWYIFKINGVEYSIPDIGIEIRIFDFDRSVLNNFSKNNYMNNNKTLYNSTGQINKKHRLYDEFYYFFIDNNGFEYIYYNQNTRTFNHQLTYSNNFYNSTDLNKIIYTFLDYNVDIYNKFQDIKYSFNTTNPSNLLNYNIDEINVVKSIRNFVYNKQSSDFDILEYFLLDNYVLDSLIKDKIFSTNSYNNIFINNSNKSNIIKFRTFIMNNIINYSGSSKKNIDCRYNKNTVLTLLLILVIKNINDTIILNPNQKDLKIKINFDKYTVNKHYGLIENNFNMINLYLTKVETDNSNNITTSEIIIGNIYDLIKNYYNNIFNIFVVLINHITQIFNLSTHKVLTNYINFNLNNFNNSTSNNTLLYYCTDTHLICDYNYKLTLKHFGEINIVEKNKIFNTTLNTFQYYLDSFYKPMLDGFLNLLEIKDSYDFNDILGLKDNGQLLGYLNFDSIDKVYFSKKSKKRNS